MGRKERILRRSRETGDRNENSERNILWVPSQVISVQSNAQADTSEVPGYKRKQLTEESLIKARLENEERKQRRLDLTELQEMWEKNEQSLKALHQNRRTLAKWSRYMRCDGSPDPMNQLEINTYINLRLEDQSRDDAENVLEDSEMDLMLMNELKFILADLPPEELSDMQRSVYQEIIEKLERLITSKLDIASLKILCNSVVLAHSETGNLQHTVKNDHIALCIWGNLMKNPRIRSHEFADINFMFDIPRVIALTDCAVRVLTTKFDFYSPTSKTNLPRMKKKYEEESGLMAPEMPLDESKEDLEREEETAKAQSEDEEEEGEKEEIEDDLAISNAGEESEDQKEDEEQEIEIEEDFPDPPTPEIIEWEDLDEGEDVVDLRTFYVVGNIYRFDLLELPPQPKTAGLWTLTQLVDPPKIYSLDYMADPEGDQDMGRDVRRDEKAPVTVTLTLPSDVLFLEKPQIGRWDSERKLWSTKGFSDLVYAEETRTFSFKTAQFGALCLLQNAHYSMPYQSWEIRPHSLNSAVFTITTNTIEIKIEIKDELCCLSEPKDRPELNSVRNKWVTPSVLIKMMKMAGLSIFPSEDSSEFVQKPKIAYKHPLIEERLYQHMALTASAMAYSQSKWNQKLTESVDIYFQGTEALEDEIIPEEAWSIYVAYKRRLMKLKPRKTDEVTEDTKAVQNVSSDEDEPSLTRMTSKTLKTLQFMRKNSSSFRVGKRVKGFQKESKTPMEEFVEVYNIQDSPFKSNLYHYVTSFGSEEARTRIGTTDFQFVDCVHQLLKATRVLTFS